MAAPLPLAGAGFDGARNQAARHCFADAFQTPRDHGPNMTEPGGRVETLCVAANPGMARHLKSGL